MAKKRKAAQRRTKRDVRHTLAAYSKAASAVLALGGGATLMAPEMSEAAVITGTINHTVQGVLALPTSFSGVDYAVFNLNGDGYTDDVGFAHYQIGTGYPTYWGTTGTGGPFFGARAALVGANQSVAGTIVPYGTGFIPVASALNSSASLGGALGYPVGILGGFYGSGPWWHYNTPSAIASHYVYTITTGTVYGAFPGAGPRFVGIAFNAADGVHYGWVRISVPANLAYIQVLDYAYESTPNTPIHLGAWPVGGVVHDVSDAAKQEGSD